MGVGALLALNLMAPFAGCARPAPPAHEKIAYKIAQAGPNMSGADLERLLNQLGDDGWLLVHALPGLGFILRR
jgi:hypothetical protein